MNITYYLLAAYNNGILKPKTFDLDYSDKSDHYAELEIWLKDNNEEEYIVCDYEDIPRHFVGEWSLDDDFWEYLDFVQSSHLDREIIDAAIAIDIPLEHIEDCYYGEYDCDEDFAYDLAEGTGAIDNKVQWPYTCVDWQLAARDLMNDFNCFDGHYFRAY